MATVFSRVVFALQHTASSHCPAVTRAHISTGRQAGCTVLYWKSHCYATYVMLPAALSVCLFISLHLFFTCLLASSESVLGHILTALSGIVKKACMVYWKTCSSLVKRQFYESSSGITEQSIFDVEKMLTQKSAPTIKTCVNRASKWKMRRVQLSKAAACIVLWNWERQ